MELIVIALLMVKHFVCDFVIQAQYMLEEKGRYGASGGIHHAVLHSLGTWAVVFAFTNAYAATIMAMLDGLIHYHIDWAKIQLSAKWQTHHWAFWVWFGLDQLLHMLTYVLIVAIIVP